MLSLITEYDHNSALISLYPSSSVLSRSAKARFLPFLLPIPKLDSICDKSLNTPAPIPFPAIRLLESRGSWPFSHLAPFPVARSSRCNLIASGIQSRKTFRRANAVPRLGTAGITGVGTRARETGRVEWKGEARNIGAQRNK